MKLSSLSNREIDKLVAMYLGYSEYTWREECSQFTSGAQWSYGGDYYEIVETTLIPPELANRTEEEWEEGYYKPEKEKSELDYYYDLEDYLVNTEYDIPKFSTEYAALVEIFNYLKKEQVSITINMTDNYYVLVSNSTSSYYCKGSSLPRVLSEVFINYVNNTTLLC